MEYQVITAIKDVEQLLDEVCAFDDYKPLEAFCADNNLKRELYSPALVVVYKCKENDEAITDELKSILESIPELNPELKNYISYVRTSNNDMPMSTLFSLANAVTPYEDKCEDVKMANIFSVGVNSMLPKGEVYLYLFFGIKR